MPKANRQHAPLDPSPWSALARADGNRHQAVRWIANPFLEAYRELMDRFPGLWVLEPTFPQYLREFIDALAREDADRALALTRAYYERIDGAFMKTLEIIMKKKSSPLAAPGPAKGPDEA